MTSEAKPKRRSRRRIARRLLLALVLVAVAGLAGFWTWLEGDVAQERVRLWVETRAGELLDREVNVARFEWNLLPFDARLSGVEIAGAPGSDAPLLRADLIRMRVRAWALISRQLQIQSLEVVNPVVHWDAGTGSNLALEAGVDDRLGITVDEFSVTNATVEINHSRWALDTSFDFVSLDLQPVEDAADSAQRSGTLGVGGGYLALGANGEQIDFVSIALPFTVDENVLDITSGRLLMGSSEFTTSGSVREWERGIFAVEGRVDVDDIIRVSGIDAPETDGGILNLTATASFGSEPLSVSGSITSEALIVGGVEGVDITADLSAGTDRVAIENLSMALFEGTVSADVEIDLQAQPRTWRLQYGADGVDLNALSTSPGFPGLRFAGIASASGDLSWQAPAAETLSGTGTFDLDLPAGTLERASAAAPPTATPPTGDGGDEPETPSTSSTPQRVAPSLPLPVSAHAEFEVENGNLTLRNTTAELPRTEATISGTLGRNGELAADIRFEGGDLRILDRFFTQVRRFRGEQPVLRPIGLSGSALATVSIGGDIDTPVVDGMVEARNVAVGDNPIGDVDATLRLDGPDLAFQDLEVRRGGGIGSGSGSFRIGQFEPSDDDYSVELRLDGFPIDLNLPRLGVALSASGEASGEVTARGSYGQAPTGLVELRADDMQLNNVGNISADIRVQMTPEEWVAERFEFVGPRGRISVAGAWNRTLDTVSAQVDAFDVDAAALGDIAGAELPLEGLLRAQAQLTGDFSTPTAAATLRWTQARAYDVTLGAVALSAELRAGAVAVSAIGLSDVNATAVPPPTPSAEGGGIAVPLRSVPTSGWAATLAADLVEPRQATVRASGDSDLVRALLAAQGYELSNDLILSGTVEAAGSGRVDELEAWQGTAVLRDFNFSQPGLGFSLPQPLSLALNDQVLSIELPQLLSDAGTLVAQGAIDIGTGRWLEAVANGRVSLDVLEALSDKVIAGGTLAVDLEASGEVLSGDITGAFELIDVTLGRDRWPYIGESLNGRIVVADGRLVLDGVSGEAAGTPFAVTGALPLAALGGDETADPAALDLTIDDLPLVPVWEKTGGLHDLITGGEASITIAVNGRGVNWREYEGTFEVRSLRVDLNDLELTMPAATTMRVGGSRVDIDAPLVLRGPGTDLVVGGGFLLGPFQLDTTLQGSANLDILNTVTRGWGVAGSSEIDIKVVGDPPELAFTGTVEVESGLLNAPILQPIENISATLTLRDRLINIERFEGSLGETSTTGANVRGSGEIQLVRSVPQRFALNLTIEEALLRIQNGIRVTASADLQHEGTFERSILSGTMLVSEGEYTRRWDNENDMFALSETRVMGIDHPAARSVTLDVEVSAPGEFRVVNNLADVELSADLQVRGTAAQPVLLGTMTVLDGDVSFRDQRYRFLRGTAEFQNPLQTEINFDVSIETSIRQYLVTLNASGSPARGDINATFVSSPPLSDLQLIQLLTVGNASDENVRSDDEALGAVGAQATSFLTRQYLSQVERGAQRVFGIDRFRVEPSVTTGSGDPTARVTIGKQVTPDLWVSYTTVIGTTEEQLLSIQYQLTRGIRLTATREERGALGFDIRFDHRFR